MPRKREYSQTDAYIRMVQPPSKGTRLLHGADREKALKDNPDLARSLLESELRIASYQKKRQSITQARLIAEEGRKTHKYWGREGNVPEKVVDLPFKVAEGAAVFAGGVGLKTAIDTFKGKNTLIEPEGMEDSPTVKKEKAKYDAMPPGQKVTYLRLKAKHAAVRNRVSNRLMKEALKSGSIRTPEEFASIKHDYLKSVKTITDMYLKPELRVMGIAGKVTKEQSAVAEMLKEDVRRSKNLKKGAIVAGAGLGLAGAAAGYNAIKGRRKDSERVKKSWQKRKMLYGPSGERY